jgi:hypothetical protein
MKHIIDTFSHRLFAAGPADQDGSGADGDGPLPQEDDFTSAMI